LFLISHISSWIAGRERVTVLETASTPAYCLYFWSAWELQQSLDEAECQAAQEMEYRDNPCTDKNFEFLNPGRTESVQYTQITENTKVEEKY